VLYYRWYQIQHEILRSTATAVVLMFLSLLSLVDYPTSPHLLLLVLLFLLVLYCSALTDRARYLIGPLFLLCPVCFVLLICVVDSYMRSHCIGGLCTVCTAVQWVAFLRLCYQAHINILVISKDQQSSLA
jgi:hypothetical protein